MKLEVFVSPYGSSTEAEAKFVLEQLQRNHPIKKGWKETTSGVKKIKGKWHAWIKYAAK